MIAGFQSIASASRDSSLSTRRRGSDRRPSVAIIGAGPGGLASAMLLAHAGCAVTVYEAGDRIGGRTRQLENEVAHASGTKRFRFDCGPTFFMMPYVLEEIFASTGRRLTDYAHLTRLDPMYRLLLGRPGAEPITLDATQDLDRMAARIAAIEPTDGPAFLRFMEENRTKLERMTPILRRPIRGLSDLMTWDTMKVGPLLQPWRSLYDLLAATFRNEQIRLALSFQSKYLGMSPFECPSLFSILPFIEYEYGVWHPRGGCSALVGAMAKAAEELGAKVLCSSPVERIEFRGRQATGVTVRGEHLHHDHVVINADASWALKNLIPEALRPRWTDEKLDRQRYSCSTFMMYLGVEGEVNLPHHTIYTSARYRGNIDEIGSGRLSEDPSTYVCNPSRLDPTLAPEGHSSLYVLVPTPNTRAVNGNAIDWEASREVLRERTYEQLARVFGLGDLRERVLTETLITPDDWRAQRIAHGATFNLAHNLGQMLHRRPQHRLEGVDGVWCVGGGTHPGSGLPVIFLSAQITSKLLCDEALVR
jgi:phytoene desaturase